MGTKLDSDIQQSECGLAGRALQQTEN